MKRLSIGPVLISLVGLLSIGSSGRAMTLQPLFDKGELASRGKHLEVFSWQGARKHAGRGLDTDGVRRFIVGDGSRRVWFRRWR